MSDKHRLVVTTLCDIYEEDNTNLTKIVAFLAVEEERCGGRERSAQWNMMADLVERPKQLKTYADELIKQGKTSSSDVEEKFVKMQMEAAKHATVGKTISCTELLQKKETLAAAIGVSFWMEIPPTAQMAIIEVLVNTLSNTPIVGALVPHVGMMIKNSMTNTVTKRLPYILSAGFLVYDIGLNIYKWHHNEISGKRCAKDVMDTAAGLAAGIGGGLAGAAAGAALAGPIGAVIGGLAGGFVASIAGQKLMNLLTTEIFDLPKDVALEKAYNFLEVNHRASDEEVRDAYKKKLLTCHPDKGGCQELFLKLQSFLGIIVVARGWKP